MRSLQNSEMHYNTSRAFVPGKCNSWNKSESLPLGRGGQNTQSLKYGCLQQYFYTEA